jgi:hypothetical protein
VRHLYTTAHTLKATLSRNTSINLVVVVVVVAAAAAVEK